MIENIIIENYKSIKELDLKLNKINVLIGANGAGKTNFISFFKFLNSIANKKMQIHISEEAGSNYILYQGLKESQFLRGCIEFSDDKESVLYNFRLKPNAENSLFFENEKLGYRDKKKYNGYYIYDKNFAKGLESGISLDESSYERIKKLILSSLDEYMVYHFHDTSKSARVKQFFNIYDNKKLHIDAANLASMLYKYKETDKEVLEKIEETIKLVAPYFDKFELEPSPFNNEQIRLGWKEKGSDVLYNANHFSDGTLRMICLITLFLQPNPPKVIILDEPELGLHPYALHILSELIKKAAINGVQIIISTQSVTLVNNFDIDDIIIVDKKNTQSIFTRMESKKLKEWLEDYEVGELWEMNILGGRP